MRLSDIADMCIQNLRRRKGRTFLTVLGVFIGCCSIIVMVSIGFGMKESMNQMLNNMGDLTVIEVSSQGGGKEAAKLDEEAVKTFSDINGVQAVMPKYSFDYQVVLYAGINNRYVSDWGSVTGIDTGAMEQMGYELTEGRAAFSGKDEAVAGQYFAYNFRDSLMPEGNNMVDRWGEFDENGNSVGEIDDPFFNPVNNKIIMEITDENENKYQRELTITGITKEDYGKGYETSDGLMVSIDTLKDIVKQITGLPQTKTNYSTINVKVSDINMVAGVETEIKNLGYSTYSMQSVREELEKSARQTQMMLGGIGAVSLFVAAIGIMNTMIMSISERTREIGIMKSLGCYVRDIRTLFLMEAGSIGLMGGVVGCIFSVALSWVINMISFGGFTKENFIAAVVGSDTLTRLSVVPIWLIGFAILFSVMVGVVSGYYPANKAVKISALEAIKNEN